MFLWAILSLMILFHQQKKNTLGVVTVIMVLGIMIFFAAHGMQDDSLGRRWCWSATTRRLGL